MFLRLLCICLLPWWKEMHSVHHSSDKEISFSPLSKHTWSEGWACSDRCSLSSSSKLFISQVLLCIFRASSTKGWINVPKSPGVGSSPARRMGCAIPAETHNPTAETHSGNTRNVPAAHTGLTELPPQGWACPAQGSTREGTAIPGLGSEGALDFLSPPAPPWIVKEQSNSTTSSWISCPCLWCLSPITSHPAALEVQHYPSLFLWMTTSILWETFPDVFTSAKFNQGYFTKVELWEAGNFLLQIPVPIISPNSSEQWLVPKHSHLFFIFC